MDGKLQGLRFLMLLCGVTLSIEFEVEKDTNGLQGFLKNVKVNADSLRPLRRTKRRWVLTTIEVEEEDPGPFPKYASTLFNDRSFNLTLKYLIRGPGVDEYPSGIFSVNDTDGRVFTLKTIDREKTPSFRVQFDAADRRTGKIVDDSLVFIVHVQDKNDNAPKFKKPLQNINLKESTPEGKIEVMVEAEDIDDHSTPNAKIVYSVVSQTPRSTTAVFGIDPTSGIMTLKGCLDYQQVKTYQVIVRAEDQGTPSLSSTATVNINLVDSNNNPPEIVKKQYVGNVKERESNITLLRIVVEDKDTPNTPAWKAKYSILQGNENNNYKIETDPVSNEGILTVIKPVDYEVSPQKALIISAQNEEPLFACPLKSGKSLPPTSTVSVMINVEDVNDPPVFTPEMIKLIQTEGLPPGQKLCKFRVTDSDADHSTIRFEKVYDPENWVKVDTKTGEVVSIGELDRESPYVNNSIYTIIVHAIDDGKPSMTGTGSVLIYLRDINDNKPFILNKHAHLCEKKTSVVINAADKDLQPYSGPFTYELLDKGGNTKSPWSLGKISENSIELLKTKQLPQGNYTVPLKIVDQQGISGDDALHLRICKCNEEEECERMLPISAGLSGAAIGAIFGAFLLMLLLLCLLLFCKFGEEKQSKFSELLEGAGQQHLIKYNEEGGSSVYSTGQLSVHSPIKENALNVNNTLASQPNWGNNKKYTNGGPQKSFMDSGLQGRGKSTYSHCYRSQSSRISVSHQPSGKYPWSTRSELQEMINMKVHNIEDDMVNFWEDQPKIYANEGKENISRHPSMGDISMKSDNIQLDIFNDLGPKFNTLAGICQSNIRNGNQKVTYEWE
ncbi:cadherin-like protein 26 isoform X1 [Polypterus senegalus]